MNPLFAEAIGSIIRWALQGLLGAAVLHQIFSADLATRIQDYLSSPAFVVGSLGVLAWSLWQKYGIRIKLLTAAASPGPVTEATIEQKVKAGEAPSVSTPKTQVPELK